MARRRWRFRRGVTAIELLVTLSVFLVLGTGLLSLFNNSIGIWSVGIGKSEADDTASLILQVVVRGIEDGKSAEVVSGGLEVQMPGINDQGDYERELDGDLVRLYVSGGNLYRRVNGGTAGLLTEGVTSFTYTIVGGTVTLGLTLSRQEGTETSTASFAQRVVLRNYVSAS